MTDIENYLTKYYYAQREVRRLQCELRSARSKYNDAIAAYPGHDFNATRSKNKPISDPTMRAAAYLVDSIGREIDDLNHELTGERAIMKAVKATVRAAELDGLEMEYVRFRYFEGRSVEAVGREMGYAETTLVKIRGAVLDKLEKIKKSGA